MSVPRWYAAAGPAYIAVLLAVDTQVGLAAQIGLAFTEDDVVLHVVPLFHVNGWGTPHFLTMVGGRHVMLRKFDPTALMALVERHRVTRLLAVPTIFNAILNSRERPTLDAALAREVQPLPLDRVLALLRDVVPRCTNVGPALSRLRTD